MNFILISDFTIANGYQAIQRTYSIQRIHIFIDNHHWDDTWSICWLWNVQNVPVKISSAVRRPEVILQDCAHATANCTDGEIFISIVAALTGMHKSNKEFNYQSLLQTDSSCVTYTTEPLVKLLTRKRRY